MTAPIKRIARKLACENTVFRIYFDHIVEGEKEVKEYAVLTMKSQDAEQPLQVTGVAILPIKNDCVALQRVWRHPIGAWSWEIPRGMIDKGETPVNAARRELYEETGLTCGRMQQLGALSPEPGVIRARAFLFAARDIVVGEKPPIDDEMGLTQIEWFHIDEALKMADRSVIEDATTLIALYRFARLVKR